MRSPTVLEAFDSLVEELDQQIREARDAAANAIRDGHDDEADRMRNPHKALVLQETGISHHASLNAIGSRRYLAVSCLAMFLATGALCAAEVTTRVGQVYVNATALRVEREGVAFRHARGIAWIPAHQLPLDWQAVCATSPPRRLPAIPTQQPAQESLTRTNRLTKSSSPKLPIDTSKTRPLTQHSTRVTGKSLPPHEPSSSTQRRHERLPWPAILLIAIAFYYVVRWLWRSLRAYLMTTAGERYIERAAKSGKLQPIQSSVWVKNGEEVYFEENATLFETRSVRLSGGYGIAFRIMRGVYVGTGRRASESTSQLQRIDRGRLVLTSRRLIFDGNTENRVVLLDNVVSFTPYLDVVEVSTATRSKSMFFKVRNPYLWAKLGRLACSGDVHTRARR